MFRGFLKYLKDKWKKMKSTFRENRSTNLPLKLLLAVNLESKSGWSKHLQVIEEGKCDSKQHVDDTQDDRHLHLERVEEGQLICGNVPDLSQRYNQNN